MATKRDRQEALPPLPEQDVLDLTGLETGEELNPALEVIYAEMGQEGREKIKVYIYKFIEESGKDARVWEGTPGDYDLMSVARRFGSGDYRVKLYVPHSSGRIVIRGNQVFPILLDAMEDAKILAARTNTPVPAQVAPMQQQQLTPEAIAVAVAQAIKAAMPVQVDAFAQMDKMASIFSKMMPQQPVAPASGGFKETLDAARALMEISKGFVPPVDAEGRTDVKGAALVRGIDLLSKMFEKGIEQARTNPSPAIAKTPDAVASLPNVSQPETTPELTAEEQEELEMLRLQIKLVNRQAKNSADVAKLAEDYYEDLPDAVFDLIVLEPNWFAVLCANVPECAEHKEWYEKMRGAIIAKGLKDGDLIAASDGSLKYAEEDGTTVADGTAH
jgi:hypothetical protein